VPFADGSESEQSLRGELLAARGLLELIDPKGLDPAGLAAAIDRAAQRQMPAVGDPTRPAGQLELDLDGAVHTARLLLDAGTADPSHPTQRA